MFNKFTLECNEIAAVREFEILQKLSGHENVLKATEFVRGNGKIRIPRNIQKDEYDTLYKYRTGVEKDVKASYLLMELCKQDLFDFIIKNGKAPNESFAKYIFREICAGVEALHTTAGYAHLDIKLENFLIGNDYKLKICDFGFAQDVNERITKKFGTESYMAPEIESLRAQGETY